MVDCSYCSSGIAVLRRSYSGLPSCKKCFIESFEADVYEYIKNENLICYGDKVCIGVSGGKDSSVLAHVLSRIKEKNNLNWTLYLLGIDEGIKGYRDDSLRVVEKMDKKYGVELKILNFKDRFGFTMDEVVELIGKKGNCTVCGSFRRQILEIGSRLLGANVLCTGHNADDMAETVLLNLFRGDLYKLSKSIRTPNGLNSTHCSSTKGFRRIRPLMYSYEKEIVLYARFLSLEYFSTECVYSPEAYRGHMRSFIKNLEVINPKIIINIIYSGDQFYSDYDSIEGNLGSCEKCGIPNVNGVCKPCVIIERLNMIKVRKEGCETLKNLCKDGRTVKNGFKKEDLSITLNTELMDYTDSQTKHVLNSRKGVKNLHSSDKVFELRYDNAK